MRITSAANPKLRDAIRLRDRRDRGDRLLIDGVRETTYALRCGVAIEHWFVGPIRHDLQAQERSRLERDIGREPLELTDELFAKLSYGERDAGAIAVARRPDRSLERLDLPEAPLLLVAEGIEKPGNIGAIARTADAVGVDGLILADLRTDPFSPNAIRASMGTVLSKRVAIGTTEETLSLLTARGIRIVAARVDGAALFGDVDLRGGTAIVVGSEAHGLGDVWHRPEILGIRLPMAGIADSLNVSTTAAILAYEAWRQRR